MSIFHSKELIELFIDEATEQLDTLERNLLTIEKNGISEEVIDESFRMAHSIKGGASSLGYKHIQNITHNLESVFEKVKKKKIQCSQDVCNVLLRVVDILKSIINELSQGSDNIEISYDEIIDEMQKLLYSEIEESRQKLFSKNNASQKSASMYKKDVTDIQHKDEEFLFSIEIKLSPNTAMKSVMAFLLLNNLRKLGRIVSTEPQNIEDNDNEEDIDSFMVLLKTDQSKKFIERAIIQTDSHSTYKIKEIKENKLAAQKFYSQKDTDTGLNRNKSNALSKQRATIRVDVNKVEKLMKLVGELVIDKERLAEISGQFKKELKKDSKTQELVQTVSHVGLIGNELQEAVMAVRMVSVKSVFDRFPRLVRDLASSSKKEIDLVIEGEGTELDRGILEEVVDPLIHIIRNAVDHGIENTQERLEKGKKSRGTIKLSARHQESYVVFEVSDDGRGLNEKKIKEKAIRKDLTTLDQVKKLTRKDIISFIFKPGFSTADKVTDVSGRGVGMDVVATNIEKLNGVIDIHTELDKGTTVTIKLPLTLAIVKALMIEEALNQYVIPLSSVIETIRIDNDSDKNFVSTIDKKEVIIWRDEIIPLIRLSNYLNLECKTELNKFFVVIVGAAERRYGLAVENLLGEQEIVIKSLGDYIGNGKLFGSLKGISGATILGNGKLALILDVHAVTSK